MFEGVCSESTPLSNVERLRECGDVLDEATKAQIVADLDRVLTARNIVVDAGRLRALVESEAVGFRDARVRSYVPLLVERAVVRRVTAG